MKIKQFILLFWICGLCTQEAFASWGMPSFFADGMVLQQQADVKIWGNGAPDEKINLVTEWDNKKYTTTIGRDSLWSITVQTPTASYKSYQIEIRPSKKEKVLRDILIGEVWFCSGQSNMDQKMSGYYRQTVPNSLHHTAISTNRNIRCFRIERAGSIKEEYDVKGQWDAASPNTTNEFPATGYYFARLLQQALDVPVAIIACSWGGSKIEAWMSGSAIKKFSELKMPVQEPQKHLRHWTPTILYNAMVHPIAGYAIRGVIWYQGESNRKQYSSYADYFKTMHEEWIKAWNIGNFPIYFCQLAPFEYNDPANASAFFREVQLKISKTQPSTAMAVLLDIGEKDNIHPSNKEVVGNRLGYIALGKTYGYDQLPYKSPEFKSINITNDTVIVSFNNIQQGLSVLNGGTADSIGNFEIAGEDQKFYPANAHILPRARVGVSSPQVPRPVAVRYAFQDFVTGTLFGANGQPVSSFRTDDWNAIK